MTVNPLGFVEAMTDRWQTEYNNKANPALRHSWKQMAEAFNAHIAGTNTHRWSVLHPPTGTGKSTGLELYCSMLSPTNHPGVLIIVRMKEDATDLAKRINERVGSNVAVAVHTDSDVTGAEQYASPVLIATHSAYEKAMPNATKWEALCVWEQGKRKLAVIDEALNIIHHERVHLDELRLLRGILPHPMILRHADEIAALDFAIEKLTALANAGSSTVMEQDCWGMAEKAVFPGLKQELASLPLDSIMARKHDSDERKRFAAHYTKMLIRLEAILDDWSLYARSGNQHSLTTARVILPVELMNAVVLDATAAFDPIYGMLGDTVKLVTPPDHIRNYSNVTLHVSVGHKTGKSSLLLNAQREAKAFIEGLMPRIAPDDKLLVCTHMDMQPHLEGYGEKDHYSVAHWGAIDGKNDWREYNTVALFGLSYLDRIIPEASLLALLKWSGRSLEAEEYASMTDRFYWGHVAVGVIQAINRVRCRLVIDGDGNCPRTNIYVLLPHAKYARNITLPLAQAMPGIQSKHWVSQAARKKLRRSRFEEPLLAHLATLGRGKHLAKEVCQHLEIQKRAFEKLIAKLKDDTKSLYHDFRSRGFDYVTQGNGRGARSWFVIE